MDIALLYTFMKGLWGRGASQVHGRLSGGRFSVKNLVEHPDRTSSLFLLSLRLPLFPQLVKKFTQTLFPCGGKLILLTKVQIVAQPLFEHPMVLFGDRLLPQMILKPSLSSQEKTCQAVFCNILI